MSKDEDSHFVSSKAANEHHASRGSLLPMDVVDPAAKQRVAQAAEGAEDDDGNMASPERSASASTDYEKRSRDSTSLSLDDDGHSRTGGNNSSARPSLDCGLANAGGEGGECSSTSTVLYSYDGNQSDSYSDSAANHEDTSFPVARADKAVQCDMFSLERAQQMHREALQSIEDLKRQIRVYDKLQK